jgi:hypothetical protein
MLPVTIRKDIETFDRRARSREQRMRTVDSELRGDIGPRAWRAASKSASSSLVYGEAAAGRDLANPTFCDLHHIFLLPLRIASLPSVAG